MKTRNLTDGPILKNLICFSLPMIAGNLLQQFYNLADTLIVGRYVGSDALAAVGSVYTLMTFITSIIIGLCMGSGALFSEAYGRKDLEKLQVDVWHSIGFIAAVSMLLYGIIYPCRTWILQLLQTPEELWTMTKDYVTIVFVGIVFVSAYNFFAYLLRSMGNSVVPLIFLAVASVLNILLDLWFVIGLQLGVCGAAYATVIAQGVSGVGIGVYAALKVPVLKLNRKKMHWNGQRMKEIIRTDLATGLQQSVMNLGILMIQALVNSFGVVVMASFAAAVKIDTIAYMPAQEFGNAYSLFVSQNYGAQKKERIGKGTKMAFATSILFCLLVSILIFATADKLMELFVGADAPAIIAEGARYLRIEGAMYIGIGILFLWYGYFRGVGRPQVSLLLTVLSLGTRVILSYALAPHTPLGVVAIWISIPIGWIFADAVGLFLYRRRQI